MGGRQSTHSPAVCKSATDLRSAQRYCVTNLREILPPSSHTSYHDRRRLCTPFHHSRTKRVFFHCTCAQHCRSSSLCSSPATDTTSDLLNHFFPDAFAPVCDRLRRSIRIPRRSVCSPPLIRWARAKSERSWSPSTRFATVPIFRSSPLRAHAF